MPIEFAFAYGAYAALSGDRAVGMSAGPIYFAAIDAYGRRYGIIDLDEFDQLASDIRLIDRLFTDVLEKKRPAA